MYQTILYTAQDGVTSITLNRPDKYNAFNNQMGQEFLDALNRVKEDEKCRVVVLSGQGKSFCSGQDLSEVDKSDIKLSEILHKRYNPIIRAMRDLNVPIIGKINGVAAGAGCSLALACDFLVASEKASFIEVFINIGLVLDSGSTYFLPRIVGSVRAFELATMGNKVTAEQALEWGLVNRVASPEELDEKVNNIVAYYKNAPTKAIALMKKMLQQSGNLPLNEVLEIEAKAQETAGLSYDYKEGVAAFKEKRRPNFRGE